MKSVLMFLAVPFFLVALEAQGVPSGQITADPEVLFVSSGGRSTTLISWSTVHCAAAQVTVQSGGGEEKLFGDATVLAIQLGDRVNNDYYAVFRNYWSWNLQDSNLNLKKQGDSYGTSIDSF